jgi:hypothetical protein
VATISTSHFNPFVSMTEGGSGVSLVNKGYAVLDEYKKRIASAPTMTIPLYAFNHVTFSITAIIVGDVLSSSIYGERYQGDLFFVNIGKGIIYHASFDKNRQISQLSVFATTAVDDYVVNIVEGPDGYLWYVAIYGNKIGRWEVVPKK